MIESLVDSVYPQYIVDQNYPFMLQSGLIFQRSNPSGSSLPSTPFQFACIAPKFYRGKCSKTLCGLGISDIGPYCREHSILYQNLDVRESKIDPCIRGLFACASKLNTSEIRHSMCKLTGKKRNTNHESKNELIPLRCLSEEEQEGFKNRSIPVFKTGDVVCHFAGAFSVKPHNLLDLGSADPLHPASYVLLYKCNGKDILVDGFIESSGIARFANSAIVTNDRSIGKEHINTIMSYVNLENVHVLLGDTKVNLMPCLVATRDIYDGDEIITNYETEYWTPEMIMHLPQAVQDYLNGKTDKKPLFFKTEKAN